MADGDLPFYVEVFRGGDRGLWPDVGAGGVEGGEAAAAAVANVIANVGLEGSAFGTFDRLRLVCDAVAVGLVDLFVCTESLSGRRSGDPAVSANVLRSASQTQGKNGQHALRCGRHCVEM